MSYSYEKDRLRTATMLGNLGYSPDEVDTILRAATIVQRVAELTCSFDIGERETKRQETRSDNAEKRVAKIVISHGHKFEPMRDARGYAFHIIADDREYGIPGRSYPASMF